MSGTKRHTLFIEEDESFEDVESLIPKPETPPGLAVSVPRTLKRRAIEQTTSAKEKLTPIRSRFPVKRTQEGKLVPVLTGSPWKHYESRYRIDFGYSFGVITSRTSSCQPLMIRTITGPGTDEKIQRIRQLVHNNIIRNIEIYTCPNADYFLISEFMATSLLHLRRAPIYPTEPQLSSILHQVLSGIDYLLTSDLVHEQLSDANILMNFAGEVKICDVEHCGRGGDTAKLFDSFSRLMMKLMDKQKLGTAALGLTHPDSWSPEAIDMFTMTTSKPTIKELLGHEFIQKRKQEELVWLVPFMLGTAKHSIV